MSISMYNLDEENKNKFCGGIIVSSHDLVANVMYEAISYGDECDEMCWKALLKKLLDTPVIV